MKKEAQQLKTQYTLSHHRNRTCVVEKGCSGYVGPNLKRHLTNVHLRKYHISEDVDRYFALGLDPRKKKRTSKKKTRKVKQSREDGNGGARSPAAATLVHICLNICRISIT